MTIPLDASGLNFRAGPGLGRAARVFYSVKQLKTAFRAGLGTKKIRGLQDLCPRPSSKVRGRAWRGPSPGRASGPGRAGLNIFKKRGCVCVCMYVCMYVCTYVRTYVRTYILVGAQAGS
jgi:hypothetical protein